MPTLRAFSQAYNTYLRLSFTKVIVRPTWTCTIASSSILSCCSYCLPAALGQSRWPAVPATAWQRDSLGPSLPTLQWSSYSYVGHWVIEHLWLSLLASVSQWSRPGLNLQHSRRSRRFWHGFALGLYFLNFVTFSTKLVSTSDKAYCRLLGSCYVHANAHCRLWSHFWVFVAQTLSVLFYSIRYKGLQHLWFGLSRV